MATSKPLPDDPLFADQWYLQNTGQSGGMPGADIDVVPAWNLATGAGVTIVVDDTGIDYTNPDNPALGDTGDMFSATLVLIGDPPVPNQTFIYTNEYGAEAAADPSRETLNDHSGGADTLNLAAVSTACIIDLVPGGAGNIGGTPFSIGAGTTVTTVYTGLGADTINVNGDADTITSEGGDDTVVFPGALASYTLARSGTEATVTQGAVTDTLNDISTLRFANESLPVSAIACFAAGTRILTAAGEVPVESLRIGDRVPTVLGARARPAIWLGHRRVDCRRYPHARPVRIEAGAFGPDAPHRDLLLSPDHAVLVGDALIPIRYLINGASIAQVAMDAVTYWHVELPRHEVLLADGLPCESYLDTGNRFTFANGAFLRADIAIELPLRMSSRAGKSSGRSR